MIENIQSICVNTAYACAAGVGAVVVAYGAARGLKFLSGGVKCVTALGLAGSLVIGGMVVTSVHVAGAKTNDTQQVGGDTNQVENGERIMGNAGGADSTLHSQFSIFHLPGVRLANPSSPVVQVTDEEILSGWRLDAIEEVDAGMMFQRPANAVIYEPWRRRGAHIDAFRVPAVGWRFRSMHDGYLDGIVVGSWGEFMPHIATNYFPRPFPDADLSLLPAGRWGMLPRAGMESLFWYAASPSNSLMLTWQNAAYGRDANCPTNFQAEIFPDGGFVYRYQDRTERYVAVSPWDWDGDGLENSVDPEPKTAGPDAHGTNAEWFNNVCSNVFAATENADGAVELVPRSSSVKTNAYYFVDVVAADVDGPAPIYFSGSQPGRLGSPVVMARAGETNHVPLLIGVEYAVTSPTPFTVSVPTNGFAEVRANSGSSCDYMVKWPLEFTFTEGFSVSSRTYTVDVGPCDPGGTFTWGGASLQDAPLPSGAGDGSCNCVSGAGNTLTFGCSSTCTCGGRCRARGWYRFELLSFAVEGGTCRCGFVDPPPVEEQTLGPLDRPSVMVAFSAPAVILEEAYVDSPGVSQPLRSTRTRLTVSAWGGPNGGTLDLSSQNLDKLSPVACGPMILPSQITLAPYQSWSISFLCEGAEASQSIDDILVEGQFAEVGANSRIVSNDSLTVVKIEIATKLPLDAFPHRHQWGVGEEFYCTWSPMLSLSTETNGDCVKNTTFSSQQDFTCPLHSSRSIVRMNFRGQAYLPITQVLEPQGIEARNAEHLEFEVDVGKPGGAGFQMDLHILPDHVSFTALDFVEVPSEDSSIEGYFANSVFSDMWYHTVDRGAGERHRIQSENFWFTDQATMGDELILPCSQGRLVWNIPIEWMSHEDEGVDTHRIGTIPQAFTMGSDGTLRVSKYQFWIERLLNGTLRMSEGMR